MIQYTCKKVQIDKKGDAMQRKYLKDLIEWMNDPKRNKTINGMGC